MSEDDGMNIDEGMQERSGRPLADYHPQGPQVSSGARVAGFRALVGIDVQRVVLFRFFTSSQVETRALSEEIRSSTVWNPQPRLGQHDVRSSSDCATHSPKKTTGFQLSRDGS